MANNSVFGDAFGLYQDPRLQYDRQYEQMKQQELLRRMQNAYAPDQAKQAEAVPKPEPGSNPVLLLLGDDA